MKKMKQKGFTVVELIISITIFFMLSMASFVPYNYYINKAKLKTTVKEISQSIYEARNMAINGVARSSGNVSIGIYFDNSEGMKNTIQFISYPYNTTGSDIKRELGSDITLIKTLVLQPGMQIDTINSQGNGLFFFHAITGESEYYYWDALGNRNNLAGGDSTIDISISYKGAVTNNLQKNITYYIKTNIIDY